jgi:carbamoyltransferase
METAFLGPSFSNEEIKQFLDAKGMPYEEDDRGVLLRRTADLLVNKNIVGWFQGRMEWGPRALGNRSIIADPRDANMKDVINQKIKHREAFRPFAPTVLLENVSEYFELDVPSPYMLLVAKVREDKRDVIPAVTHFDGTARVQTIAREHNPIYYDLITEFCTLSGVPVLLNTSFNVRGEPIVCTPEEAFNDFIRTDMDYLVMENFLMDKKEQRMELKEEIVAEPFEPD